MIQITTIEKEQIQFLKFPKKDVLEHQEAVNKRESLVNKAMVLGNIYKTKVKILFKDCTGVKKVITTIWAVTDKSIILKRGAIIPIRSILSIS